MWLTKVVLKAPLYQIQATPLSINTLYFPLQVKFIYHCNVNTIPYQKNNSLLLFKLLNG